MSLDIWLRCPHCNLTVGDLNYTHNVREMWIKAGCYDALYNSDGKKASETLPILHQAILHMSNNGPEYIQLNPANGWGSYEGALKFLKEWREICEQHPDMLIGVWK